MSNKELENTKFALIEQVRGSDVLDAPLRSLLERYIRAFDPAQETNTAKGVTAIALNPNGAVVATGTCFSSSAPGGFDVHRNQIRVAVEKMKMDFAQRHLNHFMTEKIDDYFASHYWEHAEKHGYRLEIIHVGYPKTSEE